MIAVRNFHIIVQFSYHIGVFVSRSSLQFIKIKLVWLLTLLQLVNFIILLFNAKHLYCDNIYLISPLVFWVGLMGGASYVNVLHGIRELKTLNIKEIESAMSLCLIFNDLGIFLAAATSVLLSNTYLYVEVGGRGAAKR